MEQPNKMLGLPSLDKCIPHVWPPQSILFGQCNHLDLSSGTWTALLSFGPSEFDVSNRKWPPYSFSDMKSIQSPFLCNNNVTMLQQEIRRLVWVSLSKPFYGNHCPQPGVSFLEGQIPKHLKVSLQESVNQTFLTFNTKPSTFIEPSDWPIHNLNGL